MRNQFTVLIEVSVTELTLVWLWFTSMNGTMFVQTVWMSVRISTVFAAQHMFHLIKGDQDIIAIGVMRFFEMIEEFVNQIEYFAAVFAQWKLVRSSGHMIEDMSAQLRFSSVFSAANIANVDGSCFGGATIVKTTHHCDFNIRLHFLLLLLLSQTQWIIFGMFNFDFSNGRLYVPLNYRWFSRYFQLRHFSNGLRWGWQWFYVFSLEFILDAIHQNVLLEHIDICGAVVFEADEIIFTVVRFIFYCER